MNVYDARMVDIGPNVDRLKGRLIDQTEVCTSSKHIVWLNENKELTLNPSQSIRQAVN